MRNHTASDGLRRKIIHLLVLFSFLFVIILPSNLPAYALPGSSQEEDQEKVIILSEKVGEIIDRQERDYYNLFPSVNGFISAVIISRKDGSFAAKIVRSEGGKEKIDYQVLPKSHIRRLSTLIDYYEETQRIQVPHWTNGKLTVHMKDGRRYFYHHFWFSDEVVFVVPFGQSIRPIALNEIDGFDFEVEVSQDKPILAVCSGILAGAFLGYLFRAHNHHY